jgi:nucleotide-binding universal stress UspA family protein
MIPEIKKILYTTDLSQNARYAFGYAASLANQYGAHITILHVLETLPHDANVRVAYVLGEERWKELQKRNEQAVMDTIKTRLEKFCDDMKASLVECPFLVEEIIVTQGEPVEVILKQAASMDYDIVVMGTHGQGILADAMLGSTARRVIRRSEKPVLVIRLPEADV